MERYAKLGLIYGTVRRAQMHTRIRKYIRLSNRHNHDYSSMEIIREEEETLNGLGASLSSCDLGNSTVRESIC